jgi:hypothetical protein
MSRPARLVAVVVALVVTVVGVVGVLPALSAPRTDSLGDLPAGSTPLRAENDELAKLERRIDRMLRPVREHERTRTRMYRWWRCVHPFAVDQVGDPEHGWGFQYDERDGSGVDTRTALARHHGAGRGQLRLLSFSRAKGCLTRAPDPNGTGEDARAIPIAPREALAVLLRGPGGRWAKLRHLELRSAQLERRIGRLEGAFDRFDEWESCLSWLPVTEYGHTHQGLGYLYEGAGRPRQYLSAIDIDSSEWDDPDYMLLAFLGRDEPFSSTECGHEPGESVDRAVSGTTPAAKRIDRARPHQGWAERIQDVNHDLGGALEDIEDLLEPAQEFIQFDECMFTVGMGERGGPRTGYRFLTKSGATVGRSALFFDMTGLRLPEMDVMAFPGEEPPQIECNEDAGGQNTDE